MNIIAFPTLESNMFTDASRITYERADPYDKNPRVRWECGKYLINHRLTRELVWEMTEGHCYYCGVQLNPFKTFHIDHMIPRCQDGDECILNYFPCCPSCNSSKGGRDIHQWNRSPHWYHRLEGQYYCIRVVSIQNLCTCVDEEGDL